MLGIFNGKAKYDIDGLLATFRYDKTNTKNKLITLLTYLELYAKLGCFYILINLCFLFRNLEELERFRPIAHILDTISQAILKYEEPGLTG